jgi:hypothetical protein
MLPRSSGEPTAERVAGAIGKGIFWFKASAWTVFALAGPIAWLLMRNYLGVAITGAIGVFIGLFLFREPVDFRGRKLLRGMLIAQGLVMGGYGAFVLTRPAAPWRHVGGRTRTSVVLSTSGRAFGLEFSEKSSFYAADASTGEWQTEAFPGALASTLWIADDVLFAPEDRSNRLWARSVAPNARWDVLDGRGFPASFARSDRALFYAARRRLWRFDNPAALATLAVEPTAVDDVGDVSAVCARGSHVLALATSGLAQLWRSHDGGASFTADPGELRDASLCAVTNRGCAWLASEGTFKGEVARAEPGQRLSLHAAPAPRIEALQVNPESCMEAWLGIWGAGVFRSIDGGSSWESMGLVGFEVSSLAVDFVSRRAFAGTGSGVYTLAF